jgi:hypothetical protein
LEFEFFDLQVQSVEVRLDFLGRPGIGLFDGQLQKFRRIAQAELEAIQTAYHLLELGALLPQFLGSIRVIPDAGLLEFAFYFLQALMPVVVIKDTSSKSRCAPRDL